MYGATQEYKPHQRQFARAERCEPFCASYTLSLLLVTLKPDVHVRRQNDAWHLMHHWPGEQAQ